MIIRRADLADASALAELRHALWPFESQAEHLAQVSRTLAEGALVTFVADAEGRVVAFLEASIRRDYVNGCDTSPVAFIEGLFVEESDRRRGVARALVAAAEAWAAGLGLTELASDVLADNVLSQEAHASLGFAETERVVYFRKEIK